LKSLSDRSRPTKVARRVRSAKHVLLLSGFEWPFPVSQSLIRQAAMFLSFLGIVQELTVAFDRIVNALDEEILGLPCVGTLINRAPGRDLSSGKELQHESQ